MTEKVINTIYDYDMLNPGNKVVCALSGGSDSCCLLDVLIRISGKLGITVAAAHLNHMLRGDESERDEAFVRKLCESKGIELYTEKIDINSVSAKTKKSIELSAREERYEFFRRAKKTLGADITATAHNADDNLETVLFNLVRGTGLKGLCGIPPKRGDIIRPLIRITADEIDEYIRDNGIG
ncbi:MAG: tRNA lysidine(34) synthetase TilS, partial [Clostridiales bacterium]|nr:tRNA lysidine(34) synthetase TilS [Clostridiales bacterium]